MLNIVYSYMAQCVRGIVHGPATGSCVLQVRNRIDPNTVFGLIVCDGGSNSPTGHRDC